MRKVRIIASLSALLAVAFPAAGHSSTATTLYFHTATPVANVDNTTEIAGESGPTMDPTPPMKSTPSVSQHSLESTFPKGGIYAPVWVASMAGTATGAADVHFWAESKSSIAFHVALYTDEAAGGDDPVAVASVDVPAKPETSPVAYTAHFTNLNVTFQREIMVEIDTVNAAGQGAGEGQVFYDSIDYPSSFTMNFTPAVVPPPVTAAGFAIYPAPSPTIRDAHQPNETSIGVTKTNAAMFLMSNSTAKVTFDDAVTPPKATWKDVSYVTTNLATLDPILYTDKVTGRTFVVQLLGSHSVAAYTDDDGANWTNMAPPSSAPSVDHESVGGGPWSATAPIPPNAYQHAYYYCSQGAAANLQGSTTPMLGQCARSDNGGLTWGAPVPFTAYDSCEPSHGHILVDDTGAVYVPVKSCLGKGQGVYISRDNGITWEEHIIPGTKDGLSDPALGIDKAGRVYYAASSDGTLVVSTTSDNGHTWSQPVNVGAPFGIKNSEFAMAVGGDAGKAAVAFYGSSDAGDSQDVAYTGAWYLYEATTADAGQTWTTVNVTPGDPVQRGIICNGGLGCTVGRNLLDFQGMTVDKGGRVVIGYADGCTSAKCVAATGKNNTDADSSDSWGTIARQYSGTRLTTTTP
ncbi:MAG: hypothetical protein QOI20_2815 [Acidimicrobiaceae bacterium]|jgi:hypothetical protein|nr:hypothetical protein [Acidimicrobiaceae bacterium]